MHAFQQRRPVQWVFPHQPCSHGDVIDLGHVVFVGVECLDFARKEERAVHVGPGERLNAHWVSSEDQFLCNRIPQGEGIHPVQTRKP